MREKVSRGSGSRAAVVPPTSSNQELPPSADARGFRGPVLHTSLWVSAALGSLWIAVVLATAPVLLTTVDAKIAIALLALVWVAALAKTLPQAARLGCLLAFDFGVALIGMRANGPSPGPVLLMLRAVLKSTLFYGLRGGLVATAGWS